MFMGVHVGLVSHGGWNYVCIETLVVSIVECDEL